MICLKKELYAIKCTKKIGKNIETTFIAEILFIY